MKWQQGAGILVQLKKGGEFEEVFTIVEYFGNGWLWC